MKALYRHVKSCTGVDNFLSECFCNSEVLSPILFNLYVKDFLNSFLNAGCSIYLTSY